MTNLDYFERRLDDKNRLTLPAEIRPEFEGGEVIITRGFKNYLHLYTKWVWDQKLEPALRDDILDEHIADLNVRLRTGKSATVMDTKQGRITIEPHLLSYAGIDKEVVAVRAGDYWRLSGKPRA